MALSDGSVDELAALLHRAELTPFTSSDDSTRRLLRDGFSSAAAHALVAESATLDTSRVFAAIRGVFADWLRWLVSDESATVRGQATQLALDAADRQHAEHLPGLLDAVECAIDAVNPGRVVAFFERCVAVAPVDRCHQVRAIGLLRAVRASADLDGVRRFRLLGRLGAVRGMADLQRCLADCSLQSSYASDSESLLREALSIPAEDKDTDTEEEIEFRRRAHTWHRMQPAVRTAWLDEMLKARPLGLPAPTTAPRDRTSSPSAVCSRAELQQLIGALADDSVPRRERAAARILASADAISAWAQVLEADLQGRVTLSRVQQQRVAPMLWCWPATVAARERAVSYYPWLSVAQRRKLAVQWLAGWDSGDSHAADMLARLDESELVPLARERALRGEYQLLRLLRPSSSLAMRALVELVGDSAPHEVAHLLAGDGDAEANDSLDPVDPIAGKSAAQLVELIGTKGTAKGLAVRAVHALAECAEQGIVALTALCTDRRPSVRSAALRALRKVAPREHSLDTTVAVLKMETRRDIVLQLMSSLGHGQYEPALPVLFERLTHGDYRIRQGAHAAVRAWGSDVVPALRHACRRARPDRRSIFERLIAELQI